MTTVTVTVICSVGVAIAAIVIALGRSQRWEPVLATAGDGTAVGRRTVEQLRQMCAVLAAGFTGGLLGFGLGGRLMMRLLAVTSPAAQGRLTEADEVVGEVSTDGSLFLIFFLTLVGIVGALGVHSFRPVLPARSVSAGAVVGTIGGALMIRPSDLLNPENRDFDILGPTWLAVAMCIALIGIGALTTAILVDRWVPRWPRPALSVRGILGLLPLVVCVAFPIGIAALVIVAVRATLAGRTASTGTRRLVRAAVTTAGWVGGFWIAATGVAILA